MKEPKAGPAVPYGIQTRDYETDTGTRAMLWETSSERKDVHQPLRQPQRIPPSSSLSTSSSSSSLFIADLASPSASTFTPLHLLAPAEHEDEVTNADSSHRDDVVPMVSSTDSGTLDPMPMTMYVGVKKAPALCRFL